MKSSKFGQAEPTLGGVMLVIPCHLPKPLSPATSTEKEINSFQKLLPYNEFPYVTIYTSQKGCRKNLFLPSFWTKKKVIK